MTLDYGNYGIFLIIGNAGFISSTVSYLPHTTITRLNPDDGIKPCSDEQHAQSWIYCRAERVPRDAVVVVVAVVLDSGEYLMPRKLWWFCQKFDLNHKSRNVPLTGPISTIPLPHTGASSTWVSGLGQLPGVVSRHVPFTLEDRHVLT